ncbi:hypothetical protein [Nitrincola sp. A-D6]|uniref:hypothetical protein n=1 Tax=Nitrincola sp. A-D6 TaxID=1545442 RepID=UPI000689D731|nr:hypothetical protein [Nitrincola sp. A-D6]
MNEYRHHVSGFFGHLVEAENALSKLVNKGLSREQMHIFSADSNSATPAPEGKSDGTLKDIMVDGAVGTGVGAGIGVLGSVALTATSVSLFVASPLVAPLMLIGWGASLGGLLGAAAGTTTSTPGDKEGWLSDLVAMRSHKAMLYWWSRPETSRKQLLRVRSSRIQSANLQTLRLNHRSR